MKILKYITGHKIVAGVVAVGLIGSTAGASVIYQSQQPTKEVKQSVNSVSLEDEVAPTPKDEPTKKVAKEQVKQEPAPAPVATTETQTQPQTEPTPIVLSTQAYAEKYLNLSGRGQMCFDAIVDRWPERFTPDVRENNVKALKLYYSPCSTGIIEAQAGDYKGVIFKYGSKGGRDGAFFDSAHAKSQY